MSVTRPMRAGVWPGSARAGNPFILLFANSLRSAGVQVIDVQNPADSLAGPIDVFHIHWPEQIFWAGGGLRQLSLRLLATVRSLRRFKRAGVAIVWMVHNLEPHDISGANRILWLIYRQQLYALTDGFMTLCPATVDTVRQAFPGFRSTPSASAWLPIYPAVEGNPPAKDVRMQLGMADDSYLFANLGLLRPYKGLEALIEAFVCLPDSRYNLLIAGTPASAAYEAKLRSMIGHDGRVKLVSRYLSDSEFSAFQSAADIIVLPFHTYLHSSSMIHSIGSERPVITPDAPFARSLSEEVGEGWVTTYTPPLLPHFLREYPKPAAPPKLDALSPCLLGQKTSNFYKSLLEGGAKTKERLGSFSD